MLICEIFKETLNIFSYDSYAYPEKESPWIRSKKSNKNLKSVNVVRFMYFETKRLALRNFEIKDLEELVDYRSNDLCSKFQRGQFKDNKNLTKLIEKSKNDDLFSIGKKRLAIIFKKTNEIVGDIFISIENRTISLGYTISYKYHRQGFAYELLSALIKELHKHYDKHEFVACVEKENIASKNLMLKLGFINEGYEEKISSLVFSKYGLK